MTATRIGLCVILVAAVLAVAAWFARPAPGVQYAGVSGTRVMATVALRLDGMAAPAAVTIDLGNGVHIVANRLP